jgi:hypothetical protein
MDKAGVDARRFVEEIKSQVSGEIAGQVFEKLKVLSADMIPILRFYWS